MNLMSQIFTHFVKFAMRWNLFLENLKNLTKTKMVVVEMTPQKRDFDIKIIIFT